MKATMIKLSFKLFKNKRTILPVVGIAIAVFCLLSATNGYFDVWEQKSQPFELIAAGNSLEDELVNEITKIDDVISATAVLPISATLIAGEYSAEVTLNGIDPSYLKKSFAEGGNFPDNSVMPYIVLNKAALKLFKDKDKKAIDKEKKIDWLNQKITLQFEKPVTAKICGILENEDEQPEAYISLKSAKGLGETSYSAIWIRLRNMGCEQSVTNKLSAFGLTVVNQNETLLQEWDLAETQALYLLLAGVFSMLWTCVVLNVFVTMQWQQRQKELDMLRIIGFAKKSIKSLFHFMCTYTICLGFAVGLLIRAILPSFLELKQSLLGKGLVSQSIVFTAIFSLVCLAIVVIYVKRASD